MEYVKCVKCEFRFVTDKAKENYRAEGLTGEPLLCLHCIGELTGKVMNKFGYLVPPGEVEQDHRSEIIPKSALTGCRPCMKRRGN